MRQLILNRAHDYAVDMLIAMFGTDIYSGDGTLRSEYRDTYNIYFSQGCKS